MSKTALARLGLLWDWIDNRQIVRRVMSLGTFAVTVQVMLWFLEFAETSERSGAEVAMIIGAIGVPLAGLQGYMFATGEKRSVVIAERRDPVPQGPDWS